MARHTLKINPTNIRLLTEALGFAIEGSHSEQLSKYVGMLEQWNKSFNLTGYSIWQEIFEKLVIDSFYLNEVVKNELISLLPKLPEIWDLGSGAGLPGIPFRILNDIGRYTLVEAREKRALFLSIVLANIPLKRTEVYRGRAELFMQGKQADLIISRAFMPTLTLLNFVENNITPGGLILFFSSEPWVNPKEDTWDDIITFPYLVGKNKNEPKEKSSDNSISLYSVEEKRFFRVLQRKVR